MKRLSLEEFQQRLDAIHPNETLEAIEWGGDRKESKVKCQKCGTVYTKLGGNFLDKRKKSICKVCFPTQSNTLKENFDLPFEYSYIEKYKGMHNKILIKHDKCGFIWSITPNNLKLGKGCPKCNRKVSKGEQKIIVWLEEHNIKYEAQAPLMIDGHNFFADFYLPSFDLYIEYNGEQHYQKVNFFGGEEKFKTQQYNDSLKREYLKSKLVEIPYTCFNDIEKILESSTTISKESTQQALAVEVENLLSKKENDIVLSI